VEIRFSRSAQKALLRSNKRALIRQKLDELASDPHSLAANVVKLVGQPESRLRVQDWRVIFRIEESILWIDHIGPRGSIYED
jgi:mRNA interferase RelE/StbE